MLKGVETDVGSRVTAGLPLVLLSTVVDGAVFVVTITVLVVVITVLVLTDVAGDD